MKKQRQSENVMDYDYSLHLAEILLNLCWRKLPFFAGFVIGKTGEFDYYQKCFIY